MCRRVIDLSTLDWQFGQVNRRPFGASPADDRLDVASWLPAQVPGDVRSDLIRAGRIPDIDSPAGIAAGEWVDHHDWWYRLSLPEGYAADEQVVLELDGVDYYSAVWLDCSRIAVQEGMFARRVLPLSPQINAPGQHELAIRLWGASALPVQPDLLSRRAARRLVRLFGLGAEYFPDRMMTPKAQFGFGWDFSPRVLSTGIWDDARLVIGRGGYIEDLWVQMAPLLHADRAGAGTVDRPEEPCSARCRLRLTTWRWSPGAGSLDVSIEPYDFDGPGVRAFARLAPAVGRYAGSPETHEMVVELPVASLWWPWDQGEPRLYRVTVRLRDEKGAMDEVSQVSGVRTVTRERLKGGAPWCFCVNGCPVFLRGANWVPADVLPGRVLPLDYDRLLRLAREAGVNFLRVWGGGVREKRAFWDLCDALGIMAWQEFPLACAFLDHYPRESHYLATLSAEAVGIVRALRNHPSLVAWCGGNEINLRRERLPLAAIASAVHSEDAGRPWIPASPSGGAVHQWDVWHGQADWSALGEVAAPFVTEFGLQALPAFATVLEMFGGKAPEKPDDEQWVSRKAQIAKLAHYAGAEMRGGAEAAILASQRAQATALQVGVEGCRIRRPSSLTIGNACRGGAGASPGEDALQSPCGGVALWQFNEPWPGVTWSVVDRAGRTKLAYGMLCRAYQPVLVAAVFAWRRYRAGDRFCAEIWLVNDGAAGWDNGCAAVMLDDVVVWTQSGIAVPRGCALHIGSLAVLLDTPPRRLDLSLTSGGAPLATNRYDLTVPLPGRQPTLARLRRRVADWLLRVD